jgi:hypothetical protein
MYQASSQRAAYGFMTIYSLPRINNHSRMLGLYPNMLRILLSDSSFELSCITEHTHMKCCWHH